MATYPNESAFIESRSSLQERIKAIDMLILALLDTMTRAALSDDTLEYRLNDGQTVIQRTYRSVEDISASIDALERIKNTYKRQLTGGVTRLINRNYFNRYRRR